MQPNPSQLLITPRAQGPAELVWRGPSSGRCYSVRAVGDPLAPHLLPALRLAPTALVPTALVPTLSAPGAAPVPAAAPAPPKEVPGLSWSVKQLAVAIVLIEAGVVSLLYCLYHF